MASAWIKRRTLESGATRYEVRFRIGGRESTGRYGGRFATMREAKLRRDFIVGELASLRVPDLRAVDTAPVTFAAAAERWRSSRRDVAAGTAHTYQVALRRLLPRIGERPLDELTPAVWNEFIETLAASLKRESLRKTLSVAAMVFDHEAIEPNPVRSPLVKLPRGTKRIVEPPTAQHVLAVHRLLPAAYKLALVVLESTGMRVGELERLAWGDMDEPRGRWRVAAGKTDAATRWVSPPAVVLAAVLDLVPRDDRTSERRVFRGSAATASVPRSRAQLERPGCRRSHPMIFATGR